MNKVTFGKSVFEPQGQIRPVSEIIDAIRNGEYGRLIREIRDAPSEERKQALKKDLPWLNMGLFRDNQCKNDALLSTKHIIFDIDKKGNPLVSFSNGFRKKLSSCPYIQAVFLSPSGQGAKVICELPQLVTSDKEYKSFWKAGTVFFQKELGLRNDPATKDVRRICYLSHDPDIYADFNKKPLPIKPVKDDPPPAPRDFSGEKNELSEVYRAIDSFKNTKQLDRSTWYGIGCTLREKFGGIEGRKLFNHLSINKFYPNDTSIDKTWEEVQSRSGGEGMTLGTIFKFAQEKGFTFSKVYNETTRTRGLRTNEQNPTEEENALLHALNSNEDGDSLLFQELQRGKFVYDHSLQVWFYYTGHSWKEDATDKATAAIQSAIDAYAAEAQRQAGARLSAEKAGKSEIAGQCGKLEGLILKRIRALQTTKRKAAVLNLSARIGSGPLCVTGSEWDTDPWLVGCKNGVIDLKTGEHRAGQPGDYIKTTAPVEWSQIDEPCPQWEKFVLEIFDGNEDLADYVQRLLGYGLTGLNVIHIYVILWGLGRNGKGTLLETLKHVLGDLAYKTEAELLLDQKFGRQGGTPNTGTLQLRGKRIVWASETNEGRRLNAGKLKELVGGDTLNARPMYGKRHIEFSPTHLLLLLTNNKPSAPANDYALWQRIALVPFELSFVTNPTKPNERKADTGLMEKLKAEGSGILAWLVRGCLKWQAEGLDAPEVVRIATNEYRADEDLISKFITECCVVGETYEVKAGVLYQAYKTWCTDQGHHAINGTRFGREIKQKYDSHKNQYVFYIGLGLIHD